MGKSRGNIANILSVMPAPKSKMLMCESCPRWWHQTHVVLILDQKKFISLFSNLCCGANICSWVKALVGRGKETVKLRGPLVNMTFLHAGHTVIFLCC